MRRITAAHFAVFPASTYSETAAVQCIKPNFIHDLQSNAPLFRITCGYRDC